ncbi:hypothetical protein [Streptomyces sp. NBC_00859]|uniref:hypothetical protein n=1 Tax=Streptomyces sp. NBC_00859 TaxID=2903682 RepID=UPI003866DD4E|nr:hypothetical protein OG584_10180 [Streptomyces sp. NBC_00859]
MSCRLRGSRLEPLTVFGEEGVDAACWSGFAGCGAPHRPDGPRHDRGMAAYGVVKTLDSPATAADPPSRGLGWEPKGVFRAMATRYARKA